MSEDNKSLVIFANQLLPLPVLVEVLPEGGKGVAVFMAEDLHVLPPLPVSPAKVGVDSCGDASLRG